MNFWDDPEIAKTATAVAKRFRGYVDFEDVKSVLVLWCLENESTAVKVWAGPLWFKQRRLWTIGQRYARKEKAHAVGFEIEDEFFYSPAMVRTLLPDVFDSDSTPPEAGMPEGGAHNRSGQGSRGYEWETLIADLRHALELLSLTDYELLYTLYSEGGITISQYCEFRGWGWRRGVRAERLAMRRLIDLLGGTSPWAEDITQEPQKPASEPHTATNTPGGIHG